MQLVRANGANLRTLSAMPQEQKLNNCLDKHSSRNVSRSESPARLSMFFLNVPERRFVRRVSRASGRFRGFLLERACCPKSQVAKGAASRNQMAWVAKKAGEMPFHPER
jgi:hypothetical protein